MRRPTVSLESSPSWKFFFFFFTEVNKIVTDVTFGSFYCPCVVSIDCE